MTLVTKVTQDATLDSMSAQDYRDMFDELRPIDPRTENRLSLDKFIAAIDSQFSKALWGRYDHGEVGLNRAQRSELRVAVGQAPLPPTVAEATAQASPDAAVWQVGIGVPETVIMVSGHEKVTLHVNGAVSVAENISDNALSRPVEGSRIARKPVIRPVASFAQESRRIAVSASWKDVIEAGLKALELGGL